jgi:crossover junction endodeoxyribonuclease RuvC
MSYLIGIDPGLTGALAVLTADGTFVAVFDTPTLTLVKRQSLRQAFDLVALARLLAPYAGEPVHVMLEESQSMPGQGVASTFQTGVGFGVWLGVVGALGLPHTLVRPFVWKKALRVGADKEQCRLRAQQLFPGADLHLKKHHGRSEALLIAWYAWQTVRPGARAVPVFA